MQNNTDENFNEDFERLLKQFVSEKYKDVKLDDMQTEDDEDSFLEDEDVDEDVDEYEAEDNTPTEKADDICTDVPLPGDVIEQNQNVRVKVEILRPIDNPQEELQKLVGCGNIKKRMDELVALTAYNRMLHEQFPELKQHRVSLHSLFLGNPGTGKTTVCKIFGALLHEAGALSKGHVVICDRGTFIGTLWGDEERAMKQVVEMAQGGVLMIDEAYLLNGKNENDPGKIIVQLLMNLLADESRRDIAVVLCGYKEPMNELLETNPGLLSRFPNRFEFADFSVDELLEITSRRIEEYSYRFTVKAWQKYTDMIALAFSA
ncbi:MAG: AAA family ATPase, partial [Prevotella sp.]|nr:AAA family ATPase [Prevotella sp.]